MQAGSTIVKVISIYSPCGQKLSGTIVYNLGRQAYRR
jgi:hypothetical protein